MIQLVTMDTRTTKIIESLQKAVVNWIDTVGEVSYSKMQRNFMRLAEKEYLGSSEEPDSSLFYKTLIPLVKLGIIEYGIKDDTETVFYSPMIRSDADSANAYKDGLNLLRYLPSVSDYIDNLEEAPGAIRVKYMFNLKDYSLRAVSDNGFKAVGLYKQGSEKFYPYYLVDSGGTLRKIRRRANSFECFDYASTYVHMYSGKSVFSFNPNTDELIFFDLNYTPPFIIRALCLIDYTNYSSVKTYTDTSIVFHNVDERVVKELERIMKKG